MEKVVNVSEQKTRLYSKPTIIETDEAREIRENNWIENNCKTECDICHKRQAITSTYLTGISEICFCEECKKNYYDGTNVEKVVEEEKVNKMLQNEKEFYFNDIVHKLIALYYEDYDKLLHLLDSIDPINATNYGSIKLATSYTVRGKLENIVENINNIYPYEFKGFVRKIYKNFK